MVKETKKYITLLLLFISIMLAKAQTNSFAYYDSLSYKLYEQQKWDSLILVNKQAFAENYDTYYLQVRTGVAYFNKRRFVSSIKYLQKAKEYYNNDFVNYYLYLALKYSGFNYKAEDLSETFSDSLKKSLKIKKSIISSFDISASNYSNIDYDNLNKKDILNNENTEAEISYRKKYNFLASVGVGFNISKSLKSYISYNYLNYKKEQKFQNTNDVLYKDALSTQSSFYFKLLWQKNRLSISGALNTLLINADYNEITAVYPNKFQLKDTTYKSTDVVFNLFVNYRFNYFDVNVGLTFSNLNTHNQSIYSIGTILYPFGNKDLYIGYNFNYQDITERVGGQGRGRSSKKLLENNNVNKLLLGAKLLNPIWGEFTYYIGNINEYSEMGYYIYNEVNPIKDMYSIKLIYLINNNLQFFVTARYSYQEIEYYNYNILRDLNVETKKYNTNNSNISILGGLKWSF